MSGSTSELERAGAAAGYRPRATLSIASEWRRQASRRRTQLALGFMVLLPLIILVAFQFNWRTRSSRWSATTHGEAGTADVG